MKRNLRLNVPIQRTNIESKSFYILTLGCDKNTVDSEAMGQLLNGYGMRETLKPEKAQLLIVNTCGFIDSATKQSLDSLRQLAAGKQAEQKLLAAGCLVNRAAELIKAEVPGVDGVVGALKWDEFAPMLSNLGIELDTGNTLSYGLLRRKKKQGTSAYLKISDGCDAGCAFCIIPQMKGKHLSRPSDTLLREVRELATAGVKEVVLVGQDTTFYGRDLDEKEGTAALLEQLCEAAPEIMWFRLMYAYPRFVSQKLVETMARLPQVAHYIDMPLQHAHKATLRRMRRPSDQSETIGTIARLREAMPDIAIRTTFIVGYPGETEEEFEYLLNFLEEMKFDNVGAFKYSPQANSPAALLPDQIAEEVKQERYERLMTLQQKVSLHKNKSLIGSELDVIVEGSGTVDYGARNSRPIWVGRSYRSAPEVDGMVFIEPSRGRLFPEGVRPVIARIRITDATEYDLWGKLV
ncbi:MAG: 30S ribosomal protein S12 methylthiotransferase RimO [Chloroflexi bacterium]|uniref:Ribosomal protein uS12 methylthiotransferase RimO n=1 Tax=Candidatus Chlorohelix allophototropha TaxID=3003348 RepID=A0A8T7LS67_9CHLR|nr:30S ribosomal protein S12 methylthiotransferase RimO [Chloroflexota bacterium]WJW66746.1 30S ribosomal protein S12 methylthiotransferase RimO [Chloroflexota bacterium L227-S17]